MLISIYSWLILHIFDLALNPGQLAPLSKSLVHTTVNFVPSMVSELLKDRSELLPHGAVPSYSCQSGAPPPKGWAFLPPAALVSGCPPTEIILLTFTSSTAF